MNSYPKIYSLSTVGVRQHFNADYLIHPLRTDFTGDNGLGKSIISDLMQLIFIPSRDLWKPGTEGIDKSERRIDGIPLSRDYVQYAYTFLNIEKSHGRFITIGVYIPKTSRLPVRPFIIQQSGQWENRQLEPFAYALKSTDFMGMNNVIPDLKELKLHLLTNFNLHLKDFHHTDGIESYFDFLYKNYLLPIDLTKHGNLKAFAKILQSYSRAKTLDITNTKSLQNFLFEDNDEIRQLFDDQKDKLESYIRQYRENFRHVQNLQTKQDKLHGLKKHFEKHIKAREEHLRSDAVVALKKQKEAELQFGSNNKQLEAAKATLQKNEQGWKKTANRLFSHASMLKDYCRKAVELLNEQRNLFTDEMIQEKRKEANVLGNSIHNLDALFPLFEKYQTIETIEAKFYEQELFRNKKNKLEKLTGIECFGEFEKSLWATADYNEAADDYAARAAGLSAKIRQLSHLLDLFEGDLPDSFFHWAIKNNQPLTLEQETLLMHLKDIIINKPEEWKDGTKFTDNPGLLLESFETEDGAEGSPSQSAPCSAEAGFAKAQLAEQGIWVKLGHMREYVPCVQEQRFNDIDNLHAVLEKNREEIRTSMELAQSELEGIKKLTAVLNEVGFNPELAEIFRNRGDVESYETDISLNEEKISSLKEHWPELENIVLVKEKHAELDRETIEFAKKQVEIENTLLFINNISARCEEHLVNLRPGLTDFPGIMQRQNINPEDDRGYAAIKEGENQLNHLISQLISVEQAMASARGIIDNCNSLEPLLKKELLQTRSDVEAKKELLEKITGLKLEEIILSVDYDEKDVVRNSAVAQRFEKEYQTEFTRAAESFEETRGNANPDLRTDEFNFHTLVNVLCGKLGLEGLGPELERLNEELKKFGELQLTLILDLFKKVETQYYSYRKLITELNFFFKDNKISGLYHFQIDFNERKDIGIEWIVKMRDKARGQKLGTGLFRPIEFLPAEENSPEKLIVGLARSFSLINNCEITDLLNPKFYFNLRVGLYDDQQNRFSGSGGEAYTALALLCIGRLSVIQRESFRPGVRFIIIEELSNIDDTNFNLFPEIANQFGYQLMTMTPKPFGTYSESEWYLHMLIRGKEKDINYRPMSFFRTKNIRERLEEYLGAAKKV